MAEEQEDGKTCEPIAKELAPTAPCGDVALPILDRIWGYLLKKICEG
jgi:hypothetical protein